MNATVTIGPDPMTVEELVAVARGAAVHLAPEARSLIRSSRVVIDRVLATGQPVYGLNTGVGHMKDVRLPEDALRRSQELLLVTHAGGVGAPAPVELVRAAMAARLNGIARGGSGATEALADILAAMLNEGVHPVVPAEGSVGAGDLGTMAAIGLVAIGRGRAEHRGEVVAGGEALRRAGIEPLVLQPKDGLTRVSANGVSMGNGALGGTGAAELAGIATCPRRCPWRPWAATRPSPSRWSGRRNPIPARSRAAGPSVRRSAGAPSWRPGLPIPSRIHSRSEWPRRSTGPSATCWPTRRE